jgi:CHAT domain-containing protein
VTDDPMIQNGHLDDETLAAFVDGTCDAAERARVVAHLASCDGCRELAAEVTRFAAASAPASAASRSPRRAWVLGAVAAAAAIAVGVALVRLAPGNRVRVSPEMAELVSALEGERPIEARLAGGFRWAPPRDVMRGAGPGPTPSWKIFAAAAHVKEQAEKGATDALGALGVAHLVLGDEDQAVAALEKALKTRPKDAALLTDLSAAYLTRWKRKDEAEDIIRALDTADRAIEADPKLAEPHFNRALALEALGRGEMAKKAWDDYLERDPSSEWAAEAKRRRDAIPAARSWKLTPEEKRTLATATARGDSAALRALASEAPGRIRDYAEETLLPQWAAASASGPDGALEAFRILDLVSAASAEVGRDRMLADAAESIRNAGEDRRKLLALGHRSFQNARVRQSHLDLTKAKDEFEDAEGALRAGGSPYAFWATFYLALGRYYANDDAEALRRFEGLASAIDHNRYPILAGRIDWMRALIATRRMRYAEALDLYSAALHRFEHCRDERRRCAVHVLLADTFYLLGERREQWRNLRRAIETAASEERTQQAATLSDLSYFAQQAGYLRVALEFRDDALRLGTDTPDDRAYELLYRARLRTAVGNSEGAAKDVEDARAALALVTQPQLARRIAATLALTNGELFRERSPAKARELFSTALEGFKGVNAEGYAEGLLLRGRAALAEGDLSSAERDFEKSIEIVETARPEQGDFRVAFFERGAEAYDEMVRLQALLKRRPEAALAWAERARARALLDQLPNVRSPLKTEAIRSQLPVGSVLLYYSVQADRLLAWVVNNEGVSFRELRVREGEIVEAVRVQREALARGDGEAQRHAAAALYDMVFAFVHPLIPEGDSIVVVPDGPLASVSFAGLFDTGKRRYLIEESCVSSAPSGTILVQGLAREASRSGRVLVVAWSGSVTANFPSIAPLPAARDEARDIAAIYPGAISLEETQASASAFLAQAPRCALVHFAGHAMINRTTPSLSCLVLAPNESDHDDGMLFMKRLGSLSWPVTDLVVLAGCGTGDGARFRGEGVLSLARSFLSGGVRAVIATLWDVPDRPSRRLLLRLHQSLHAGKSAAAALREAQVASIESADTSERMPSAWAAFQVVGSPNVTLRI